MAVENTVQDDSIAIVGMSCRLSGGVSNLDDFWTLLSRSRDGWRPIPDERFSSNAYYHPNQQKKGCFNQKGGYFMNKDFAEFDAPFFQITEQEALAMDPQQRQLLECGYEALENAGIPKESISGTNMGVFVGGASADYRINTLRDLNQAPLFDSTGTHQSIQAARLSYYFDLRGPSFAVDTACSSGLYALHSAVQSIRSKESNSAMVAGCSLHLQPDDCVSMSMLGLFSDHGKTYSFDDRATSGFARGDGVGCIILKPLKQAMLDNDRIRAVIVGTGTNQDGRTPGLTTPSGDAQERLMRDVYARASISPDDVGFVEAHGTGTKVGDPIEAGAINRVFGSGRTKRSPLYLGSVKSNVGHLEHASGIVSVIKAALMLEKGFVLPNVNFRNPNPAIPLDQWNIKVPTKICPWPRNKKFISVNNFGFGGSNAHAVLEGAPGHILDSSEMTESSADVHLSPQLFVLSAHDKDALRIVASKLGVYIEQHPEVYQARLVKDIAYTLGERRSHLSWRVAVPALTSSELALSLNEAEALFHRVTKSPSIAFVYTGQGAQWPQMGRELMQTHPVFAAAIETASEYLSSLGAEFSLMDELCKPAACSIMSQAHISQPACTAVQLGLTALLSSWGVKPSSVVGHSSGEIGAAYATGAITFEEAMAVAYYRGKVSSDINTTHSELQGAMLAVGLGASNAEAIIESMGLHDICVACQNSPESSTISGNESSIDRLDAELERRNIFRHKLAVDVAYHSAHMQLVAEHYKSLIRNIRPQPTSGVNFYSSLLGKKLEDTQNFGPCYWTDNLTQPVLFSSAVREMYNDAKPDILVEIGPHAALGGPLKQILKSISKQAATDVKYFPSLLRNKHATTTSLELAGKLFSHGTDVNFRAINQCSTSNPRPTVITDFSPYPWSGHKYWFESRISKQHRLKPFARHDLLGLLDDNYNDTEPTWRNHLCISDIPWLKHHQMQSLPTFPLAGYLCMAVEAAAQRSQLRGVDMEQVDGFKLREIQASKALLLEEGSQYETLVSLRSYAEGTKSYSNEWDEFRISSWTAQRGWLEHCRGLVSVKRKDSANTVRGTGHRDAKIRRKNAQSAAASPINLERFYTDLEERGAGYSHSFRLPQHCDLRSSGQYSACTVTIPDTSSSMPHSYETGSILPAAFVDLMFQLTFPILGAGCGEMPSLFMPSSIKELEIVTALPNKAGEKVQVVAYGRPDPASSGPVDFSIDAWNGTQDQPVARLVGFRMTPVNSGSDVSEQSRKICYKLKWDRPISLLGTGEVGTMVEQNSACTAGDQNMSSVEPARGHSPLICNTTREQIHIISGCSGDGEMLQALVDAVKSATGEQPAVVTLSEVQASPSVRYICLAELETPILHDMNSEVFANVRNLLLNSKSVLWVTTGAYRHPETPHGNVSQGLLRTVRSEASKNMVSLDLDPCSRSSSTETAELILQVLDRSARVPDDNSPVDYEFAEEAGELVVPRVVEDEDMNLALQHATQPSIAYLQNFEQPGRRLKVAVGMLGALNSLYWKDEDQLPLAPGEIEIKIAFTGMNFKDVVIAMGQVPSPYLGVECSGTVYRTAPDVSTLKAGDRVCAMSLGAYGTFARCPATSATIVPAAMSLKMAASIPVVYSTAYYGLTELARLEDGEKVLIHAASGGVGQAAIQLAQSIGAEIYATVGSAEKKAMIMDTYDIPESHIFYSRDASFGPAIREVTQGKGVDVVINSLAGDLLRETWECLAPFGRFIEIGKRDIVSNTRLEMSKFDYNCTFSSVDMTLVAAQRPKLMERVLNAVLGMMIQGEISPIGPITEVGIADVETALRKLQSGKTTGKVVVNHLLGEQVKATHPRPPLNLLDEEATYIIIGGTGGLGRSIAKMMCRRGARQIVLLSRSGRMTPDLEKLTKESASIDASIHIKQCDVSDASSVSKLITQMRKSLPPVKGIIHAAMVLKDVLFESMTHDDYMDVIRPKVSGAWNFHNALIDAKLDFFVLLSSVAGIVGNRGQGAYAAANTFLDAFAQFRRRKGLSATSLDLTAIEGVGYLADNATRKSQILKNLSGNTLNEAEVLALVELAIQGKMDTTCEGQCITGLNFDNPSSLPYYAADAKFTSLRDAALASLSSTDSSVSESLTVGQKTRRAANMEEALEVVRAGLRDKLSTILMVPVEVIDAQKGAKSITAMGLDSLNAIELRNWISTELQTHMQVLELLTCGGLVDLAGLVLKKTAITGAWSEAQQKSV